MCTQGIPHMSWTDWAVWGSEQHRLFLPQMASITSRVGPPQHLLSNRGPGCSGGCSSVVSPGGAASPAHEAVSEAGESALPPAHGLPPGLCQQPLCSLTGSLIAEPRWALAMFLA